ncbi:MAG: hypothetical protein EHM20_17360, partial [Alphaproteobacteria bacterium]
GLSIFLELGIELSGDANSKTGLIINVSDIDKKVRDLALPIFIKKIKSDFKNAKHTDYKELEGLLKHVWQKLDDKFGEAHLSKLTLKLNPFRTLTIDSKDYAMVYYSEKFEFAAAHKLWNNKFSQKKNVDVFGRCANPAGHGHNYIVEVTVKYPEGQSLKTGEFERVVYDKLIKTIDHKNLNQDLTEFKHITPTVENIAVFAWDKLVSNFKTPVSLHCVTVWETDKTFSSYYGEL